VQRERRERRVQFVAWNSVLASSLFVVLNCYMLLVLKLETEEYRLFFLKAKRNYARENNKHYNKV
jgi:hypothetical protein